MIKVVGKIPCQGSVDESDEWIPFKVTWVPRISGQPLYLRFSGRLSGEVELKVDPDTGALVQAVVIESPPAIKPPTERSQNLKDYGFAPVLDRSLWRLSGENSGYTGRIVTIVSELGFVQTDDRALLRLSELEPARYLQCEDVIVGISQENILVEIITTRLRSESQL